MTRLIAAGLFSIIAFVSNTQAQSLYTGSTPAYQEDYSQGEIYPPSGNQGSYSEPATYGEQEILTEVESFFGQGAENLAITIQKIFREQGEPNGYIAGEEVGAALGIGLRYGRGVLSTRQIQDRPVFWQGPSIGLDLGVNVAKVFILIYRLPSEEYLFQRFPGVEGSLYFIGGVGVNYLQSGDTVIAPIRLGAGWRQGVNAGYMDFTKRVHYNPF